MALDTSSTATTFATQFPVSVDFTLLSISLSCFKLASSSVVGETARSPGAAKEYVQAILAHFVCKKVLEPPYYRESIKKFFQCVCSVMARIEDGMGETRFWEFNVFNYLEKLRLHLLHIRSG